MPGIAFGYGSRRSDGDQGEHGTGKFISASVVLPGSSAAGPPDMKWFIDSVWRQRVSREVALLRKLGRQRRRASLRALFDRLAGHRGAGSPAETRHGHPRLQVPTNASSNQSGEHDVHA
jgi:hypothetical protein